jgi:hypothetical protein
MKRRFEDRLSGKLVSLATRWDELNTSVQASGQLLLPCQARNFLDEAVALAAGHRPCFHCRRDAAESFRNAFAKAGGAGKSSAAEMDDALHVERLVCMRAGSHALTDSIDALPDGAIITAEGAAFTIAQWRAYRWTEDGYDGGIRLSAPAGLLTPPSTLAALRCGYRPLLHPSITHIH